MSEGVNPWLSRPVAPEPSALAAVPVPTTAATGPSAPQRGIPAPDRVDQLPTVTQPRQAELWVLGTHGGAAESSLAALVPQWAGATHGWPRTPGVTAAPVLLTCRSSMRGLRSAQLAATQWAAGLVPHARVVGLVVVADAPGRLPRALRDYTQVVAGGVPRTWTLPWIESWRLGDPPETATSPREVRRLVDELTALLRPGAAGTTT